jgi:TRAP-type uncharacterized transport system fused permease subunit
MSGSPAFIVLDFASAVFGAFVISVAVTGYLGGAIAWPWRIYAFAAGLLLFTPSSQKVMLFHWGATAAGLALAVPFLIWRLMYASPRVGQATR